MNNTLNPVVILMAKAPRPGLVKTRLAERLGNERACAVYRWMVERQLSEIPTGWRVEMHFAPPQALREMQRWLGDDLDFVPQTTGDLGVRMCKAAESAYSRLFSPIVLIGGDCPELRRSDLEEAAHELAAGADVVFGPATDGGYYLLGLRELHRGLFERISWSSSVTLEESVARAAELGLKIAMLPEKEDVDTIESFERAVRRGLIPAQQQFDTPPASQQVEASEVTE